MNNVLRPLLALGLPLLAVGPTQAALNPAIVGADSQWLLHLDLNALRESTLGKELVSLAAKNQPPIANGSVQIDFQKLLATIGTVTAYGANLVPDPEKLDGTLVFQGTPDLRKIAEAFVAQATITTPEKITELKDLPFEAYSVDGQLMLGFPKEQIVIVSKSKAQLVKARDVFSGAAPSLAKASSSPLLSLVKQPGRPYLLAASVVPTEKFFAEGAPQARILQMANSGAVSVGENNRLTSAHVQLVASSDDAADKLSKILQGIAAMVSLAETTDKQLAEFLQSVKVERSNKNVTLDLAYSSDRLVEMLRTMQQQNENRRTARRQPTPPTPPVPVEAPKIPGKIVGQWAADQDFGSIMPTADTLTTHKIENVTLATGTSIIVTGQRNDGEHARLDYVEVTPAGGGQPLRFEAEAMTLNNYQRENLAFASGKRVVRTDANGSAQFQFPGVDGAYNVNVRYLDEKDGSAKFTVSIKDPEAGP
jgi:hypothetical protein